MRPILVAALFAVSAYSVAAPLAAQVPIDSVRDDRNFTFYDRGPYRASVPRPETILGYSTGEWHTQFALQERTLLAIANAATDRVRVEEIGSSYERRTMRLFIVSAPENIARLDAIRADLDKIGDPRGTSAAELEAIAARTPAVVMFNMSVHGDEVPGFEASMQLLYQYAASEEPATMAALKNTIVVINPSTNPDGHERFSVWYNANAVGHPDEGANEHQGNQPWSVRGRYNHYRFDMNRDVMATTQREAQAVVRGILRWHPMVAADMHGYTTQYYFPPAARPVNANIGGAVAAKWLDAIGKGNADAFDNYGWSYYVRDIFDYYAPVFWDVVPALMGATGLTYETDGGPAFVKRRDDGTILSLRDGIAKHYVAGLATVETTARRSAERVKDYLRFRQGAIADGRTGRLKRVVLVPGTDPGRAAELVSALLRNGIEVRQATSAFSSARAHAYYDEATGTRRFEAGSYVVDLAQPQGKVAKAFLELDPELDPVFAKSQFEKFRRNQQRSRGESTREGYEFYDLAAWSLPVTYGVEAYWTEDAAPVSGTLLTLPAEEPTLPQATATARRTGGELLAVEIAGGITGGERARSAYLFAPTSFGSSRLAYHLLANGFRVAVASMGVEVGGKDWPRGTYVVRVARNDSTLHAKLDLLARESGVQVVAVNTAFPERGQFGTGSESTFSLRTPQVAIVGDEGISLTDYGAIWWSFERRYGIKFMPISMGYLSGSDLTKFNVIIIPDASGGALNARLGKDGAERLKSWVQSGGTLITMGGASAWAARESVGLTSARVVEADTVKDRAAVASRNPASDDSARAKRKVAEVPDKALDALTGIPSPSASSTSPTGIPGSHFDVVLDRTHWLTFGYERPRVTVMLDGSTFFKLSKNGSNVGVFPSSGKLFRAGFVWPDNTERLLKGTAYLIEEPMGDGHVVLFANEPMFRGWWRALDRLVLNAVVLGPAF